MHMHLPSILNRDTFPLVLSFLNFAGSRMSPVFGQYFAVTKKNTFLLPLHKFAHLQALHLTEDTKKFVSVLVKNQRKVVSNFSGKIVGSVKKFFSFFIEFSN